MQILPNVWKMVVLVMFSTSFMGFANADGFIRLAKENPTYHTEGLGNFVLFTPKDPAAYGSGAHLCDKDSLRQDRSPIYYRCYRVKENIQTVRSGFQSPPVATVSSALVTALQQNKRTELELRVEIEALKGELGEIRKLHQEETNARLNSIEAEVLAAIAKLDIKAKAESAGDGN